MERLAIPTVRDHRGNLAFIQQSVDFPFVPANVMWGENLPVVDGRAAAINLATPEHVELLVAGQNSTESKALQIVLLPALEPQEQTAAPRSAHRTSSVDRCLIIPQKQLSQNAYGAKSPFAIRRIYFLYATPPEAHRGGHSHFAEHRLLVAVSGSFRVVLSDGFRRRTVMLSNPGEALYIPPGIWRELDRFSPNTVCLAMSSTEYDPNDYVRSKLLFNALTKSKIKR
ncbi:MAG: FdtA/QdtA family cupin domain-containing protein [Roseburia sp.]|nr:FdtA/QdtA family cupin domain-containing protein [Roseburia sp.]